MTDEIITTSSSGGQKGVKPERHSLLPRQGLDAIARVFAFGATKYADHNWRLGYEWTKSFDALLRHVQSANDGETYDPESGLPHLAHAGFHILVLLTWLEQQGEGPDNPFDDRWASTFARLHREEVHARFIGQVDGGETEDAEPDFADILMDMGVGARLVEMSYDEVEEAFVVPHPVVGEARHRREVEDVYGPDLLRKHRPVDFINDAMNPIS